MSHMTVRMLKELFSDEKLDQDAPVVFQDPNIFSEIISAYQINSGDELDKIERIERNTGLKVQPGQNVVVLWGD